MPGNERVEEAENHPSGAVHLVTIPLPPQFEQGLRISNVPDCRET